MKILLITDLYPVKENEDNTPKTLYNFVQCWKKAGHEVKIIKPNFILNSFVRKKPFYKSSWYGDVLNINYWLPFCGNIKKKLNKFLKEDFGQDIIIAHMPSGILFANKFNIPFVAGIHCSDIEVLTNPLYSVYFKPAMEKALKNSVCISCRSFVLKDKLIKLYPEFSDKIFVAPSGVAEENIIENRSGEINADNLKVITCANYKKRKNIDKLIYAVKDISGVELAVIGKGYEKYKKIDNRVKFFGRLNNKKVLEEMRKSDIFILPSTGETFGMVYLEAMASGCITVCSQNDGIDGIIKNGENGFTVRPEINEIKTLIKTLKTYDNVRLQKIREESLKTVLLYTETQCSENYLANIRKFFCK